MSGVEAPSIKHQITNKLQAPNPKAPNRRLRRLNRFGNCRLETWCLFVAWCLQFGALMPAYPRPGYNPVGAAGTGKWRCGDGGLFKRCAAKRALLVAVLTQAASDRDCSRSTRLRGAAQRQCHMDRRDVRARLADAGGERAPGDLSRWASAGVLGRLCA